MQWSMTALRVQPYEVTMSPPPNPCANQQVSDPPLRSFAPANESESGHCTAPCAVSLPVCLDGSAQAIHGNTTQALGHAPEQIASSDRTSRRVEVGSTMFLCAIIIIIISCLRLLPSSPAFISFLPPSLPGWITAYLSLHSIRLLPSCQSWCLVRHSATIISCHNLLPSSPASLPLFAPPALPPSQSAWMDHRLPFTSPRALAAEQTGGSCFSR